jgi:hypothetical protein
MSPRRYCVTDRSAVECDKVRQSSRVVSFPSVKPECSREFRTCRLVNARAVADEDCDQDPTRRAPVAIPQPPGEHQVRHRHP